MQKPHFRPKAWAHSFVSFALTNVTHLFSDLKVTGLENIPRHGGALLICNHLSYFDAVALAAALDKSKRDTMVLAKAELFESKVLANVLSSVGTIPVYRGTEKASDSLKEACNSLKHGELVAMFPEGTIPHDGQLLGFKTGAARLALEAGVPVVPIAMVGTNKVIASNLKKVKRTLWKSMWRLPSIHIHIGEPVTLAGVHTNKTQVLAATEVLRGRVERLLVELEPKHTPVAAVDKKVAGSAASIAAIPAGTLVYWLMKRK